MANPFFIVYDYSQVSDNILFINYNICSRLLSVQDLLVSTLDIIINHRMLLWKESFLWLSLESYLRFCTTF